MKTQSRICLLTLPNCLDKIPLVRFVVLLTVFLASTLPSAFGQLTIPTDGSDGALNVSIDTVIDLSLAVTGNWNDNNAANVGKGVYDRNQWAIVFKYSSVNIANGVTVSFKNHPSHAPVVWLVQGDTIIEGAVSVDGRIWNNDSPQQLTPTEPGPGGFRGGAFSSSGSGDGYGPAGTHHGDPQYAGAYGSSYGNPEILPLMGGSGAGAVASPQGRGSPGSIAGSSGGGAILIATAKTLTVNGRILARGMGYQWEGSGHANISGGGAIRLIADKIVGIGEINSGNGRTRTEANSMSPSLVITPNSVAVPAGLTPIWPPAGAPSAKVVTVNALAAPPDALADVLTASDINIQTNGVVDIIVETKNFPPNGSISLRVNPKYGTFYDVNASYLSGTFVQATWKASTSLPQGFCVLQAHATSP